MKQVCVYLGFFLCLVIATMAVGQNVSALHRETIQLTAEDGGRSRGTLVLPSGGQPKTVVIIVHRFIDNSNSPLIGPLAEAGIATFGHASRFLDRSEANIMEELVLDMAAAVKHLRDNRKFDRIVILGGSGGGQMPGFYQQQAELPPEKRVSSTPAGNPPDLRKADLPKADGIILASATEKLVARLDPSILREDDMFSVDPRLDMYNPANGYDSKTGTASYSAEFLKGYRQAQWERLRRLDRLARYYIEEQKLYKRLSQSAEFQQMPEEQKLYIRRKASTVPLMVIYGAQADPALVDLSLEPSDREVNREAFIQNATMEGAMGRVSVRASMVTTPQAFLSSKSEISGNDTFPDVLKPITAPILIIEGTADLSGAVYPRTQKALYDAASASRSRKLVRIEGADHGFSPSGKKAGTRDQRKQYIRAISEWIRKTIEN